MRAVHWPRWRWCALAMLGLVVRSAAALQDPGGLEPGSWPFYGRDPGGTRYSPLTQVNRGNVHRLQVAWIYRTGDVSDGSRWRSVTTFENTPLMADGTLYVSTPFNRVIALDPETGAERWSYDPIIDREPGYANLFVSRGVTYWVDNATPAGAPCRRRLFMGTNDGRLVAVDAERGTPCPGFGDHGQVDLRADLKQVRRGQYQVTSPPALLGGLVIVGSAIGDNYRTDDASGVVRAYDARTGREHWRWDPIPKGPRDPASATWENGAALRTGQANVWSIISVDADRDLVFLPTSSPSPDYYGGERRGDNRYANSVVALRGSTGEVVWHFQAVHHDLWDYDLPAQPVLVEVERNGTRVPGVAQVTKMGHVFLLHRETGMPLFPIEERPVPASTVDGELASLTQPFPVMPRPLVPYHLTPDDAWGLTPDDRGFCRGLIERLRWEGIFTPPSLEGTLVYPGNVGGSNWSGAAFDPVRSLLIVNTNRLATIITLVPRADSARIRELRELPIADVSPQYGTPYVLVRAYLASPQRLPCTPPPWGTLSAVNLNTGDLVWEVPLGTIKEVASLPGADRWGSPSLGGAIVTAGGLIFIAAAMDNKIRALDIETGSVLWEAELPAGGQATPMTYQVMPGGRQYLVIAAGGHGKLGTTLGDYLVAFALP